MGGRTRVAIGVAAWSTASGAGPSRTLAADVEKLAGGRETPGPEALSAEQEGLAYRYASAANEAAFEKDPLKFRVADSVRLPKVSAVTVDDKPVAHAGSAFDNVGINPDIPDDLFAAPQEYPR